MKWIVKIFDIEPYMITCLWNDNETRIVDLCNFIHEKAKNPKNSYSQLKDKERFLEAKCDVTTIYWEDSVKMIDYDGTERRGPLDIDPHILFEMSQQKDKR
ncbi:MAG: hypothetical protein K9H64_05975 [Bacteroidales bacterium]|nr:hypothetical protein [Bacteroidales bacterium]MCF8455453.1 hypothetical protein [Bacteroidales bacterium]